MLAVAAVLGLFYVGHGLPISGNSTVFAQDAKLPKLIWHQVTSENTLIHCECGAKIPGGWLVAAYEAEYLTTHGISP